jgi:hypothetical protein
MRQTTKNEPTKTAQPAVPRAAPGGKLGILVTLLSREDGVAIDEMTAATGWQAHSVRGAIAGALKKKHGLSVTSDKSDRGRVYRIAAAVAE